MLVGTGPSMGFPEAHGETPWARYAVLDTGAEAAFDTLTTTAAHRLGVAHSNLSIVTPIRVWLKSSTDRQGISQSREETFCATVAQDGQALVVTDASASPQFAGHPRVGVPGGVRFYAGVPLIAPDGLVLGVLSAWDEQPKKASPEGLADLAQLADHATALLELRRSGIQTRHQGALLAATTDLLELIVGGSALSVVLDTLARAVEDADPSTRCSIQLLDGRYLRLGAAPSLPASFLRITDGVRIGPTAGSCGTAAFTRRTVVVPDIATDPLWVDHRRAALAAGLRACWSVPIIDAANQVLGTFAQYYDDARAPGDDDLRQMTRWVDLAAVAISRAADVAAIRTAATRDALTGLTNRTEALRLLRAMTAGVDSTVAVLFVDLDQFKFVNDSLGHAAGDRFLVEISRWLSQCARPQDVVARIGGDEFLLICPDVSSAAEAEQLAERVATALRRPLPVHGRSLTLSVSVGIAIHPPEAGPVSSDLVADADLAMYAAKRAGRNSIAVFDEELRRRAVERLAMQTELTEALTNGDLYCVYQPVVYIPDRRLVGVEALLRWTSATRGEVDPEVFLAAAEHSGQILAIGEFLLRRACSQTVAWEAADPAWNVVVVAVNISPRQLADPGFETLVRRVLRSSGLTPDRLSLAITGRTIGGDPDPARTTVARLRTLGVRVAIDDFGTGFSSSVQLKMLPADLLRIDRSFVNDLIGDPSAAGIVEAVIALASRLGLTVTADGIETSEQCRALAALGCVFGQGLLWSEPLTADRLFETVRNRIPGSDDPGAFVLAPADPSHR